MRTKLCKVAMWQGKPEIKNQKNITNKFFYYLYFILSASQNTRKDSYPKNPVGEKEITPMSLYQSREDEYRRQEKKFLGRRVKLQGSPSRELWIPCHHRELRDKQYPTEAPPDHRCELPGNYPVFIVVMVIYTYVWRIMHYYLTPNFSNYFIYIFIKVYNLSRRPIG